MNHDEKLKVKFVTVETKAIYDNYGEYGLKEGCVTPEGNKIGGGYFLK